MLLLKWKDAYSMNEENIDKQHKWLFKLSNDIYDLIEKGVDDYEHFRELFMALNDYGIEHFIYEEMYMKEQGYPNLEEHIKEHRQFSDKVRDLIEKETHIKDIGEFVSAWLVQHVLDEDMNYKNFIESKSNK
ncbi:MAG: hemerythrin family protein [Epsilonproteobacteria bacterium]|nr:hemerythrin family protein [Campylobacterota bacterium]